MASDAGFSGEMGVHTWGDDFNALDFMMDQSAARNAHITWARVMAVGASTVDVQPLVTMLNGQGQPMPHGTLYGLPYVQWQGGTCAVIMAPVVGDIGLVLFADRDMSSVKATKTISNPGSRRRFDMADGCYLGGILNDAPSQFVEITPTAITVTAPTINLNGTLMINGAPYLAHEHSGVQGGSSNTGGVV